MKYKEFKILREIIEEKIGMYLPDHKKYLVENRLMQRLRELGLNNFSEYIDYISKEENANEIYQMIDKITTHQTYFFREKDHFEYLENIYLPKLSNSEPILLWSVGTSTGEEAYSLAITILEYNRKHNKNIDFKVYASDVSRQCLEYAYDGIYTKNKIENVPDRLLKNYFLKHKDPNVNLVKVKDFVKEHVEFFYLNLNDNFLKLNAVFDIIFFRNVLIYFNKKKQYEFLIKILNNLKEDGLLFLGHSESIINFNLPLKLIKNSIYQKTKSHGH